MTSFYVTGDEDYCRLLNEFRENGYEIICTSNFCSNPDKFPDIDELFDVLNNCSDKCLVIGLGEYLALRGEDFALKILNRTKNLAGEITLLLRGIPDQAKKLLHDDNRIIQQNRAFIAENIFSDITITNIAKNLGMEAICMKKFLSLLENGDIGNFEISTALNLNLSLFPVTNIANAYELVKLRVKDFRDEILIDSGSNENWTKLLRDIEKFGRSMKKLFAHYGISEENYKLGDDYESWLAFLYLKFNAKNIHDPYLKIAVNETLKFDDFKRNLLVKIIDFSHDNPEFITLYESRKRLVKNFDESEIEFFIRENDFDPSESIYRLTDNTLLEKKAVIKWISRYGFNDAIKYVYPALYDYLKQYIFDSQDLTTYFDSYKNLKLTNKITSEFMNLVIHYAENNLYAKFPARDNAVKNLCGNNSFLYWIDALGVEYLSYINALARQKNLSIQIEITRSNLPTITSMNKNFYENWPGDKFKEEKLDDIKHDYNEKGYFFASEIEHDKAPIYIPDELEVIKNAIERAYSELNSGNCKKFIIASDHGASRLAVIANNELKYQTDTKGEHSGRFCKFFEGYNVPHSICENDFIILSDYGRFKGSRKANIEVHGGASLEEILVPVITLTLNTSKTQVIVKILNPDKIIFDRKKGVTIALYISEVSSPDEIKILIDEKIYRGQAQDNTHFLFCLNDIKSRKAAYNFTVLDGNNVIANDSFTVKSKLASEKDFDF